MNIAVPVSGLMPYIPLLERTAVTFVGAPGAFASLLVEGSVLQIPTAGFYRFWLVTDIRRHLWATLASAARPWNTPAPGASS